MAATVKLTDKELNIVLDACALFADEGCAEIGDSVLISSAMAKLREARTQRAAAHARAEEGK